MKIVYVLIGLAVGMSVYIRLAPSDPDTWHLMEMPDMQVGAGVTKGANNARFAVVLTTEAQVALRAWQERILETPRTRQLAGSVEDGRMTFVTRSLLWGFPDYTTIEVEGGAVLRVWSRARFGGGDGGVNAERLRGWVRDLGY